jgi:hypothetical protein
VIPIHYLYHLYNGVSFAVGSAIYLLNRRWGIQLPGALPLDPWPAPAAHSADGMGRTASSLPALAAGGGRRVESNH